MWRAEMKHFCDQDCLLKFYCQQNEPIMVTQKGPENSTLGTNTRRRPFNCSETRKREPSMRAVSSHSRMEASHLKEVALKDFLCGV